MGCHGTKQKLQGSAEKNVRRNCRDRMTDAVGNMMLISITCKSKLTDSCKELDLISSTILAIVQGIRLGIRCESLNNHLPVPLNNNLIKIHFLSLGRSEKKTGCFSCKRMSKRSISRCTPKMDHPVQSLAIAAGNLCHFSQLRQH